MSVPRCEEVDDDELGAGLCQLGLKLGQVLDLVRHGCCFEFVCVLEERC